MVSSSCSTTISVLPRSRSRCSVINSLSLSLWCKPIEGSSRIYSTPISEEPIWVARRIRWLSPPDKVDAALDKVRYCRPTSIKNCSRDLISRTICSAISAKLPSSFNSSINAMALRMGIRQKSIMPIPPTVTARAISDRRSPWQLGQGAVDMHSSSSFRAASDWVSRKRRLILFKIPSKGCSSTPIPFPRL